VSAAAAGTTVSMSRPRRRLVLTLLALSIALNLFFIAGAAWTRLQARAEWPSPEQRYQQMAAELDLDSQQRAGFDRYVAAMRARTANMREQVAPLIAAAWQELGKPQADQAQVMRLFDEAAEKRREFQREATTQTLAFLAVLSPAQRSKFVTIAHDRRAYWRHRGP
jgi:Spy/CpxP family protein refolding chaperone